MAIVALIVNERRDLDKHVALDQRRMGRDAKKQRGSRRKK
jgi:hypothetical protein